MRHIQKRMALLVFISIVIVGVFLVSCGKKESEQFDPKSLVISKVQYSIRQTHSNYGNSYVLDAKGKIKNTGKLDVKNVTVTGICKSCVLEFTSQKWFTSDCEKTENQKDIISYLAAGAETDFAFEEVGFYFTHSKTPPENQPESIEIVVTSVEPVENP